MLPIGPGKLESKVEEGHSYLEQNELGAIYNYVEQGGGLLVLSYYTGDWHHGANLNKVLAPYQIKFEEDVVMPKDADADRARNQLHEGRLNSRDLVVAQPAEGNDTDITRRELRRKLLKDVKQIATLSSCSLSIGGSATAILISEPESILFEPEHQDPGTRIISHYKRKTNNAPAVLVGASLTRKVIAVGSWKTFLNEFIDATDYNNGRLYENVLSWLTAKPKGGP